MMGYGFEWQWRYYIEAEAARARRYAIRGELRIAEQFLLAALTVYYRAVQMVKHP